MRCRRMLGLLAIVGLGCARPPLRFPERSGWGASQATLEGEPYPVRFPKLDPKELERRRAEVQAALPGWRVSVADSGFFASADLHYPDDVYTMKLTSDEIALAQHFIDTHLALFGLDHATPLRRWHDGLYYISPVDDPRFGIVLTHDGPGPLLAGHLWPGFTMQSARRRDPNVLLAPYLGRRIAPKVQPFQPCDRRDGHPEDCSTSPPAATVTIGLDNVGYAVYASEEGDELVVRELLVIPFPSDGVLLEPEKGPIPPSVDARTGEPLEFHPDVASMCEQHGPCFGWGWFDDERYLRPTLRAQ